MAARINWSAAFIRRRRQRLQMAHRSMPTASITRQSTMWTMHATWSQRTTMPKWCWYAFTVWIPKHWSTANVKYWISNCCIVTDSHRNCWQHSIMGWFTSIATDDHWPKHNCWWSRYGVVLPGMWPKCIDRLNQRRRTMALALSQCCGRKLIKWSQWFRRHSAIPLNKRGLPLHSVHHQSFDHDFNFEFDVDTGARRFYRQLLNSKLNVKNCVRFLSQLTVRSCLLTTICCWATSWSMRRWTRQQSDSLIMNMRLIITKRTTSEIILLNSQVSVCVCGIERNLNISRSSSVDERVDYGVGTMTMTVTFTSVNGFFFSSLFIDLSN